MKAKEEALLPAGYRMTELGPLPGKDLPEPEFANWQGGVRVTFRKDPYTPDRLQKMGLNERQIKAVMYARENGIITNNEYHTLAGLSKPTATRDLESLVSLGILEKKGTTGRGVHYVVTAHKGLKGLEKGSERAQRGHIGDGGRT